jgi:hypothetical protein
MNCVDQVKLGKAKSKRTASGLTPSPLQRYRLVLSRCITPCLSLHKISRSLLLFGETKAELFCLNSYLINMPSFTLQPHTKHILLASSIVVIPMVAFTTVLLVLVFDNLADYLHCPHEEICPESPAVNHTSSSHYYVDFPATRLVFVSSLSSTISFALVGALLSIYAYCAAARLTKASVSANQNKCLPTSYQTSLLVRLLSADYLSLWELWRGPFRSGTKAKCHATAAKPTILRASIVVFCLAIFARCDYEHGAHHNYANKISISVHAADTYLHVATEAVNLVQIFSQTPDQYQYGRAIDPWCFDNHETMGTKQNKNFWGCAMTWTYSPDIADETVIPNNGSNLAAVFDEGYGKFIMNFTEETGIRYAVVGPRTTLSDIDWQATSFAISSQCTPIPWTACIVDMESDKFNEWGSIDAPFTCSLARGAPIDFSGTFQFDRHSYSFSDFHKYLQEDNEAFLSTGLKLQVPGDTLASVATNCTEQDLTEMFPSTWRWTAIADVGTDTTIPEDMIDIAWPLNLSPAMVVSCNSTGKFGYQYLLSFVSNLS